LTIADIPALAAYCVAYARWREARRRSPGFARGTFRQWIGVKLPEEIDEVGGGRCVVVAA
jgi:hypothetical protein